MRSSRHDTNICFLAAEVALIRRRTHCVGVGRAVGPDPTLEAMHALWWEVGLL